MIHQSVPWSTSRPAALLVWCQIRRAKPRIANRILHVCACVCIIPFLTDIGVVMLSYPFRNVLQLWGTKKNSMTGGRTVKNIYYTFLLSFCVSGKGGNYNNKGCFSYGHYCVNCIHQMHTMPHLLWLLPIAPFWRQ